MWALLIMFITCVLNLVWIQSYAYSDDALGSGEAPGVAASNCATPENSTLRVEEISFQAVFDGSLQHYVVMFPKGYEDSTPHDVLIALHGHGSDRWQFIKDPRPECKAARDVADRRDMIFVSPDYRAKTSWMGPAAEADTVQIIEEMKSRFKIGKVYICGGSMGGTACLIFAVLHPDLIAGVASMNGTANLLEYDNFQDAISASYGGDKKEAFEEYRKRSPEFFPERLTMPVGITAGSKDDVVPAASVVRLGQMLEKSEWPTLIVYRESGGHETEYEDAMKILNFITDPTGTLAGQLPENK